MKLLLQNEERDVFPVVDKNGVHAAGAQGGLLYETEDGIRVSVVFANEAGELEVPSCPAAKGLRNPQPTYQTVEIEARFRQPTIRSWRCQALVRAPKPSPMLKENFGRGLRRCFSSRITKRSQSSGARKVASEQRS
ncbi:uncharacterized protein LOC144122035 [Amblyomma americanum]